MVTRKILACFGLLLLAECTRSPSPVPLTKEDTVATGTPSTARAAVPEPASTDAAVASDASSSPPGPKGVACESDDDCGWDDPCAPKACGAKVAKDPGTDCGRPKTPGACRCAGKLCTLIRSESVRNAEHVACKQSADCGFDSNQGSCISAVSGTTPESGVGCACDTLSSWCVQMWQGDVACKSPKDCSWQHLNGGGTSAAPSWFAPRPKPVPVRPCKDGEHDSVCRDGKCAIVAWKC